MTTPELLEYVRGEIAKGKTREEIHGILISGGGWSEDDLSEAFRIIIPMQRPAAEVAESEAVPNGTGLSDLTLPAISGTGTTLSSVSFSPSPSPSLSPVGSFSLSDSYTPSSSLLNSTPSLAEPLPSSSSSLLKFLIISIIIGGLGFGSWYYRSQLTNFWDRGVESSQRILASSWNSSINSLKKISLPSFNFAKIFNTNKVQTNEVVVEKIVEEKVNTIKDCGTSITSKMDDLSSYENDPVLACLGASALNCENARGVIKDDFFPTIFEVTKLRDSCNFRLSYGEDSTLMDITGNKLAFQYISCPINIVKAIDNTNPTAPQFIAPDKKDLNRYAGQIYFYGTLGLFIENNLDQNKIQSLGCEGGYILSVIESYNKMQKK